MYTPAGPAHLITNYSTHEEGISGCFCALYLTAIHDIHGMLDIGSEYAKDNVAMPWHKQAASKGDGCSLLQESPSKGGFFIIDDWIAVLLQGLLS